MHCVVHHCEYITNLQIINKIESVSVHVNVKDFQSNCKQGRKIVLQADQI